MLAGIHNIEVPFPENGTNHNRRGWIVKNLIPRWLLFAFALLSICFLSVTINLCREVVIDNDVIEHWMALASVRLILAY